MYGFTSKVKTIHGNRYDYSLVTYINNYTKIKIICSLHGPFLQRPKEHLNGQGCPKCKAAARVAFSPETFVVMAQKIHGQRYDYSKTIYEHSSKKVEIICRQHGSFSTRPLGHLRQNWHCPACRHIEKRITSGQFLEKANRLHQNKYLYDLSMYEHTRSYIHIECPEHGLFRQRVSSHLNGNGCPECAKRCRLLNTDIFIKRAKEIHNHKYDYRKTKYIQAHENVSILCPTHGQFIQKAYTHLEGRGCAECADEANPGGYNETLFESRPDLKSHPATLYLVRFNLRDESFLKIGITIQPLGKRFKTLNLYMTVLYTKTTRLYEAFSIEQQILIDYASSRYHPKLKKFGGHTECMNVAVQAEILARLKTS